MKFNGLLATDLSGSLGGITASRNKGGAYFRNRATPTNPNSVRQQATRTALANFASRWTSLLDQAERDAWNTYAQTHTVKDALGNDIKISGLNWYIKFNSVLEDAALTAIVAPPPGVAPIGFSSFSVAVTAGTTGTVTFADALITGAVMQLWQTLPGTQGQTPNFKQARLVGYSAVIASSPVVFTLPHTVAVGEQSTFYGKQMNALGQLSVASVDGAIGAA